MSSSLEAAALSVSRGGRSVLRGVSFAVQSGETYALLGGNGAGKSTTLLTFLGFLRPDSGAARVLGRRVETDIAAARRAIAYLPESAALYDHLDARENLQYLLDLGGSRARGADIERALDEVALPDAARSRRLAEHSKGMRQKVALALALLRDSEVLLLDEPTSGLDPLAIDEFHALVRRLAADGKAVLMVTHDLYGACRSADRIGLLRDGALVNEFVAPTDGHIDMSVVHQVFAGQRPA
ncbi:MAG: ABC transporter ATP-binding protein [Gammaproteobacteria bacterium]